MTSLVIMKCEGKESVNDGGDDTGEPFVPPINFANVEDRIYRSGFPQPSNFPFLETLQLRSVINLCPEPYPRENLEFLRAHKIQLFQFGIDGTREPSVDVLRNSINEALKFLIDVRNHPVLIHCKRGKHRTGCVVGSLRKLQNWCLSSVLEEYKHYAGVKSRDTDLKFLETYDVRYLRECLQTIICQYHGYGSKKRRLLSGEEVTHKSQITSFRSSTEVRFYNHTTIDATPFTRENLSRG
ncbi:tyrosine phosphatase family protein [Artemisia annua]|uniref:diphosphoinositol-polyphosphate diphosphatase n=1 Tax=Artemisia annua TaxID=35608 RepID=A0A2U1PX57_ARTAN|nr:tyrosine phosphatase family protein [Artemisia annua]